MPTLLPYPRKIVHALTVLFILNTTFVSGQFINVNAGYPPTFCAGKSKDISIYMSGLSNLPATYPILLSDKFGNFDSADTTVIGTVTFVAQGQSTVVSVTPPNNAAYSPNYYIKVKSPFGNQVRVTVNNTIEGLTASLSGNRTKEICNSNLIVPVNLTGQAPWTFSIFDSTTNRTSEYTTNSSPVDLNLEVGTYRVTAVSNACGAGVASGSTTITPIFPTFSLGTPSDSKICSGEIIKIPYSLSSSGCYPAMYLSDKNGQNFQLVYPLNYGNNSEFVIETPVNLPTGTNYRFKMVVSKYISTGSYRDSVISAFPISITQSPAISLLTETEQSVFNYNQKLELKFGLSGTPPFDFLIDSTFFNSATNQFFINKALKDNGFVEFGSVSDATGCSNPSVNSKLLRARSNVEISTFLEETNKGVSDRYIFRNYCKGQQIKVRYEINGIFPTETPLKVQFKTNLSADKNWIDLLTYDGIEPNAFVAELPNDLKVGRYVIRVVPQDPTIDFRNVLVSDNSYTANTSGFIIIEDPVPSFINVSDTVYIRRNERLTLKTQAFDGLEPYNSNSLNQQIYSYRLENSRNESTYSFSNYSRDVNIDTLTKDITFKLTNAKSIFQCSNANNSSKNLIVIVDQSRKNLVTRTTGWNQSGVLNCGGKQFTVSVDTIGTFNPDNVVTINLARNTELNNYFPVPTISLGNNQYEITLPQTIEGEYFFVRAIASSPATLGKISDNGFSVVPQVKVELTGEYNIIAGSYIEFPFTVSGQMYNSRTIYITDGTTDYPYYLSGFNGVSTQVFRVKTSTGTPLSTKYFTIKPFDERCGAAIIQGQAVVNVVAQPAFSVSNPQNICDGQYDRLITFDVTGGDMLINSKAISARFIHKTDYYLISEVEAAYVNGKLKFVSPQINFGNPSQFYLQFVSKDPFLVSNLFVYQTFNGLPRANYATSFPNYVEKGTPLSLNYTFEGTPPFTMKALEGENVASYTTGSFTAGKGISVEHTMSFRILQVQDANCKSYIGPSTFYLPYYRTVKVIQREEPVEVVNLDKKQYCRGGMIRVTIKENPAFNNYKVQIAPYAATSFFFDITTVKVGNILEGQLPDLVYGDQPFQVRISYMNGNNEIQYSKFYSSSLLINENAGGTISGGGIAIGGKNAGVGINFQLTGSAPWDVTYTDGTKNYSFTTSEPDFSIKKYNPGNSIYTLLSVKNGCGTGSVSGQAEVNILSITTKRNVGSDGICYGQDLIIPFEKYGKFAPANEFKIQLYYDSVDPKNILGNYYTLNSTYSGNSLYATIPDTLPFELSKKTPYYVRVISTNPRVIGSYAVNPTTSVKQKLMFWGEEPTVTLTGGNTILAGESAELSIKTTGSSDFWYIKLSDDSTEYNYFPETLPYKISFSPTKTTTYSITKFSSACGGKIVAPSSQTIKIGVCEFAKVITVNYNSENDSHYAATKIQATNKIVGVSKVSYYSGGNIELLPGFSVDNNAVFKAEIKGCQ